MNIEKVELLVKLANDKSTTEHERRNAALAACELLDKLNILPTLIKFQKALLNNDRMLKAVLEGRVRLFRY